MNALLRILVCFTVVLLSACKIQNDTTLAVRDAYAYAPLTATTPGVAYFTLANGGTAAITVQEFSSNCFARAELHSSILENGAMQMRPVSSIRVEPLSSLSLRPGGLHLMLITATSGVEPTSRCELTVRYDEAKTLTFDVELLDRSTYRPAEPVK